MTIHGMVLLGFASVLGAVILYMAVLLLHCLWLRLSTPPSRKTIINAGVGVSFAVTSRRLPAPGVGHPRC